MGNKTETLVGRYFGVFVWNFQCLSYLHIGISWLSFSLRIALIFLDLCKFSKFGLHPEHAMALGSVKVLCRMWVCVCVWLHCFFWSNQPGEVQKRFCQAFWWQRFQYKKDCYAVGVRVWTLVYITDQFSKTGLLLCICSAQVA